jgi:GTPase SAR1 family protein
MRASGSNSTVPEVGVGDPIRIAVVGQAGVGKSALVVRYLTRRFIWEYDPTLECVYKHQTCIDGKPVNLEILDTGAAYEEQDRYSCDLDGRLGWADGVLVVYSVTDRSSFDVAASLVGRLQSDFDASTAAVGSSSICHSRQSSSSSTVDSSSSTSSPANSDPDDSADELCIHDVSSSVFPSVLGMGDGMRLNRNRKCCVVVVGNKYDLATERRVSEAEGVGLVSAFATAEESSTYAADRANGNQCSSSTSGCAPHFVETSARDGGTEIAAAFDAVCRLVLERRRQVAARLAMSSGERSPISSSFRGSTQSLAVVDSNKRRFVRRAVLLQVVNRLVRKLHV